MPDLTVGIYQPYDYPDLFRQTSMYSGKWGNIQFQINDFSEPLDVLVVLNKFSEQIEVECGQVWLVVQEPPVDFFPWIFEGHKCFNKIFSSHVPEKKDARYVPSHGALPWHVDMTYDELSSLSPPKKTRRLSWITTNKTIFPGHKRRMEFLEKLRKNGVQFELFGRGFNPLDNKYDGLAPYAYSLAVENHDQQHYWTEKVADCFLSWTMPLYYGCSNLAEYFPKESFVQIDIDDPKASDKIKRVISSDLHIERRGAIEEARELVLNNYQFFPFLAKNLQDCTPVPISRHTFKPYKRSLLFRIVHHGGKLINKIRKKNNGNFS